MNAKIYSCFSLGILGGALFLSGCQGDERLSEVSAIQSEAQLQAENENLAKKSKESEDALIRLHRFYQAIDGKYEGEFQTEAGITVNFRVILWPSLYPNITNRIRPLDQISNDINNLSLNVLVKQWNSTGRLNAVECKILGIQPHMKNGEITIASSSCPNFYRFKISENGIQPERAKFHSAQMSEWILDKKIDRIETLIGEVQLSPDSSIYTTSATRKD